MTTNFIDSAAPYPNGKAPTSFDQFPHGLLKPPNEVLEHLSKEKARLPECYTRDFEKLTLDDLTLAYYYEGTPVAYRSLPEGVEVLAVGILEIGELVRSTPPEQRPGVRIKQP
jgi:hypothetical protein